MAKSARKGNDAQSPAADATAIAATIAVPATRAATLPGNVPVVGS